MVYPQGDIKEAIRIDLTKNLYANFFMDAIFLFLGIIGIYWGLFPYLHKKFLLNWAILSLVILTCRITLGSFYWYNRDNFYLANYFFCAFFIGSSLSALLWGLLGSVLMPNDLSSQILVLAVVSSIVGGGIYGIRASFIGTVIYIIFSMGPVSIWFYLQIIKKPDVHIYEPTFFMILGYILFLIINGYNVSRRLIRMLKLQHENKYLAVDLSKSKNDLEILINAALEGVWYVNENFEIISVNNRLLEMSGYSLNDIIGKSVFLFMDEESKALALKYISIRRKTHSRETAKYEIKLFKKDGNILWASAIIAPQYDLETNKIKYLGMITDITEQKIAVQKLKKSEEKYRLLVEVSPYGVLTIVDETMTYLNKAMVNILNGKDESEFVGKSVFTIIQPTFRSIIKTRLMDAQLQGKINEPIQQKLITIDGKEKLVETISTPINIEGKPAVQVIAQDISGRVQAENRIAYLSSHDPITGLYNRKSLNDLLRLYISRNNGNKFIIMFINIDRFKKINQTLGLGGGDLLLQAVARKFKKYTKSSGILARLEADQFVLVFEIPQKNVDALSVRAKEINSMMREPFIILNESIYITVSIGISIFPEDGEDIESLFKNADIALHYAKDKGGNNFQFCTDELKKRISIASSLEAKMRRAITTENFYIDYQPKLSLKTGTIIGFEGLLRWEDPDTHENISPAKFIPLVEEMGQISKVTEIVVKLVVEQISTWKNQKLPIYPIAINLSAYDFRGLTLINYFDSITKKYNVDSVYLEIEITESAFFQSISNFDVLKAFKNRGIAIAIDDFGVGYSSLSYLQYLEVDYIKIDQSFIKNVSTDPNNSALVSAMIAMAHGLDIKVIAEGVETAEELAFLRLHDCDIVQGFYVSRPVSSKHLATFLKKTSYIAG